MHKSPLTILMVSSSYPRYSGDTASIFIKYLANALANADMSISVVAPGPGDVSSKVDSDPDVYRFRYFIPGLERLAYGSGILPNLKRNPFLWIEVPFFMLAMLVRTFFIARRIRPDVIHAHWLLPQGPIALIVGKLLDIPVITTAHGADAFGLRGNLFSYLKKMVVRRSNAWTSNTKATASSFSDNYRESNHNIIPMGVDIDKYSQGDRTILRSDIDEDKKIILFVGRLVKKKGVDSLLKAFAILPSDIRENVLLWIVGDGDQRNYLNRLSHELNIQDDVSFFGRIGNDLLPNYYATADLFVGPSTTTDYGDTEGQGIVFAEAAASHLCVLATNSGGIPEVIVDGETGILVPPDDYSKLSKEMAKLLSDKEMRDTLAENAYDIVSRVFDWNSIANQFRDLYISLKK